MARRRSPGRKGSSSARKLMELVEIQFPFDVSSGIQSRAIQWRKLGQDMAQIISRTERKIIGGREVVTAQTVDPIVTHLIYLRWRDDITPAMRIRSLENAKIYNIGTVTYWEQRRFFLELQTKEVVITT